MSGVVVSQRNQTAKT